MFRLFFPLGAAGPREHQHTAAELQHVSFPACPECRVFKRCYCANLDWFFSVYHRARVLDEIRDETFVGQLLHKHLTSAGASQETACSYSAWLQTFQTLSDWRAFTARERCERHWSRWRRLLGFNAAAAKEGRIILTADFIYLNILLKWFHFKLG